MSTQKRRPVRVRITDTQRLRPRGDGDTQTTDTLFDPGREGWKHKPTALNLREWCSPGGAWLYIEHSDGDITLGSTSDTDIVAHYTSRHHPTRSLVHEIIRQNGGDA